MLRSAITAFIAGGSLLLFLPQVPSNWLPACLFVVLLCVPLLHLNYQNKWHRFILIALIFSSFGFAWNAHYAEKRLDNVLAEDLEEKELTADGRVTALPQSSTSGAKFAFELECLYLGKERISAFPKQIYLSWQPAWRGEGAIPSIIPGQRWRFKVKLKRPYGTLNPYTFDFERWAFHQDFGASGSVKSGVLQVPQDIGFTEFQLRMELARWKLREKIRSLLPKDARYTGVMIALVMGDQNAIEQEDWRVFNATGIGHLISISGLHVTMLAGVGASLGAFLWRRRHWPLLVPVSKVAAASGFITAFIYAWLAGFQIPAQRTMYMVGVVAYALWTGRNPRSFDIWWWALALVLLVDPMAPYTPGFWLSFGAVAAILFAMKDSPALLGIPTGRGLEVVLVNRLMQALREACRVQAVVTIALLPITLYWFYQTSIVSPIANAVAIPLVSYVVTPLAIMGALMPDFIGSWLLFLAHLTMQYLAGLLEWLSSLPWAVAWSRQPDWWLLFLVGAGIVYAIRPGDLRSSYVLRFICLLPAFALFLPTFNLVDKNVKSGEFRATVLDIGQGTAVLVETANKVLLYDTGPIQGKRDDAGQRVILPYLRGRGIDQIDRLVISHSDSDHVGGAISLLKEISFRSMLGSLPASNNLLLTLRSKSIPSLPCRYGQHWVWDNVEFFIWHPHENTLFADQYVMKPNEISCVLEVRNQHGSFWLTGDVEKWGEAEIVERLDPAILRTWGDRKLIFMAPHHGSKTSSSEDLLTALKPDIAFAQNGYRNRYGHPHPSVTARYEEFGIPFYQTPKTGTQIWTFKDPAHDLQNPVFWRSQYRRLWHRP